MTKNNLTIALLVFLLGCVPTDEKHVVTEQKVVSVPSLEGAGKGTSENLPATQQPKTNNCHLDKYVERDHIPELAKAIYLDQEYTGDDCLALLDSLTAQEVSARPFYLKVVTKTLPKADGAFAEGLGNAGKEYVESHTLEFASCFENKVCFGKEDLQAWVDIVMLEFSLLADNELDREHMEEYMAQLTANIQKGTSSQKETMNEFMQLLKKDWASYLKNSEQ